MMELLLAIALFIAGAVVGFVYAKVCRDDENLALLEDLDRENTMLWASVLILQGALRESQGRHYRTLEENGGISLTVIGHD